MAEKICSLNIVNKKANTRAVGRSVIGPHASGLVHFYTIDQVAFILKLEEEGHIEIKSDVPSHIMEQVEAKKRADEKLGPNPVQQARDAFNGVNVHQKNSQGWNSPNQAYRGEDLADREGGFASTSSTATQEDSETSKETPNGEEPNTTPENYKGPGDEWNSPDDAYRGEDLKDRDYTEEGQENKGDEAALSEKRNEVGPQDQSGEGSTNGTGEEVKGDAADQQQEDDEEEEANSDKINQQADGLNEQYAAEQGETDVEVDTEGAKPSYYLTYDQVEEKTKQQLIDWADQELPEGELKLSKSSTAAEVKEQVHEYLSSKFSDHAE